MNLLVHHLRFTLRATTLVHFGPHAGAQLRGALWIALREFACSAPVPTRELEHSRVCPMCRLLAMETARAERGASPPRPLAIRPPLAKRAEDDRVFYSGDQFSVEVSLFGDVADVLPYICQAFDRMGQHGAGYGRGRFFLEGVQSVNPLTNETLDLLYGRRLIATPGLPLTPRQIAEAAAALPDDQLALHFLTPTQLTAQGRRLDIPLFAALVGRLLERCQALELHYTSAPTPQEVWRERYITLNEQAKDIRLVADHTRWVHLKSGSRRTDQLTSISGFVGQAQYCGDLAPFREWLLWGQCLHVGKNAVKGNGWYTIPTYSA